MGMNTRKFADSLKNASRAKRRKSINAVARGIHQALGHEVNGNLMTDSPDAAAVQYLAIRAMGGKDTAKTPYRPKNVREAVTRIADAAFRSHDMVADRVNILLTCLEVMQGVEIPFYLRVVKDGRKVVAMLLATKQTESMVIEEEPTQTSGLPWAMTHGKARETAKEKSSAWGSLLAFAKNRPAARA